MSTGVAYYMSYRLLDSDIELEGIIKEAIIVLITSAMQALVYVAFFSLTHQLSGPFFRAAYISEEMEPQMNADKRGI